MLNIQETASLFKGRFIAPAETIAERLHHIKAFVFDWDGVFNGGWKTSEGSSPFSETDAMGTNLLRFNHHLRNRAQPFVAIITGENNKAALDFAKREHVHAVYSGIKYKAPALDHLNQTFGVLDGEVAFMFDDVLDLSISARAGLRTMVGNTCNPLLQRYAVDRGYVDYVTENFGGRNAIREMIELFTGLSGRYDETITERVHWTPRYKEYVEERNEIKTQFFTVNKDEKIVAA